MSNAQYSTVAVAAPQRFDYWKEVVCRHCIPAASKPLAENDFDGQLEVRGFGPLDICTVSAPLHQWDRTPQHLRSGPDDDLWLGFMQNGFGEIEQDGRRAALAADSLVLYDASQTFRFSLGGRNNHLVRIPRHLLSARLPGIEKLTAVMLDDRRPGVVPLREMMRQAATTTHPGLQEAGLSGRFSQTLLDLLVLSLEMQDGERSSSERDLYPRMMNYILRHLTEQDLNIERLALAHHVSPRTVTRTFARHQKAPMSVIWQQRLQASREAIERGNVRSVSQAALEYGFSDFSHFSHAFRKAFGIAPHTLIRR